MTGIGTAPPGYPKPRRGLHERQRRPRRHQPHPADQGARQRQGPQFDFDFFSGEWPEYVCTTSTTRSSRGCSRRAFTGTGGDLNISFDAKNNPVSVNNAFFETLHAQRVTGCCASRAMGCGTPTCTAACTNGPSSSGTGFEDLGTYCGGQSTGGGSTGWLTTKAPVKPGETITLQFIIWDTGDPNWDSSVLVDHFTWQPGPTMTGRSRRSRLDGANTVMRGPTIG